MRLPNHTTLAAYGALFLALTTGGAYAATVLPKNSVSSRQIKDRSVRLADAITDVVTDPATGINIRVTGEKGDPGPAGPAGAQGPAGAPGIAGYHVVTVTSPDVPPTQTGGDTATCPAGQRVLGGGANYRADGTPAASLVRTHPTDDGTGWIAAYTNNGPSTGRVDVYAVCAAVNG